MGLMVFNAKVAPSCEICSIFIPEDSASDFRPEIAFSAKKIKNPTSYFLLNGIKRIKSNEMRFNEIYVVR